MVDLVVFDWDGTLMDSADRIVACMQGTARDNGLDEPSHEAVRNLIGLSLPECFSRLHPGIDAALIAQLNVGYREHWLAREAQPMPLFDGVCEGLSSLDAHGILLGVATGKARRGLNKVLEQSKLGPMFVATRGADEARPKPDPTMLLQILDVTGVEADRALMIGDTTYDMQMAASAGVSAVGVNWGSHGDDELRQAGALSVCQSFSQLVTLIEERAGVDGLD